MARQTPEGIELKCQRCKRTVLLPWRGIGHDAARDPGIQRPQTTHQHREGTDGIGNG